jgi:hypothetical protein
MFKVFKFLSKIPNLRSFVLLLGLIAVLFIIKADSFPTWYYPTIVTLIIIVVIFVVYKTLVKGDSRNERTDE